MAMHSPDSKEILRVLGYEVDSRGNVRQGLNQLAVFSLESTMDGGILRIHSDDGWFFYSGDPTLDELSVAFPVRVTQRYVYFDGDDGDMRVANGEFVENALKAFGEYNRTIKKKVNG